MKIFKLLFVFVLIMFSSCSENNGDKTLESLMPSGSNGGSSNTGNTDYAPEALKVGQCVNWWGSQIFNGEKYAEADKNNPNAIQILNSTDHQPFWYSDWGTYQYKKTGKNSATLYIIAPRHLNGGVVQTFSYSMNLSFYNATSFEMTGSLTVWHSLNGTTYRTLECYGVLNNSHGSSGFSEKESNTNNGSSNTNNGSSNTNNGSSNTNGNSNSVVGNLTGSHNGHAYLDLGLSVKWATCNVGATTPEGYGDYFAWGETETKTTYNWSTYKYCNGDLYSMTKYCTDSYYGTVDNKTTLELSDDAARANWGGSWRMPTRAEQDELRNTSNCTWTWTTRNGVNGYKVTSKKNGNSIFLPAAGHRSNGSLSYAGSSGYYWSSSLNTSEQDNPCVVHFRSGHVCWDSNGSYYGMSVRPVCP